MPLGLPEFDDLVNEMHEQQLESDIEALIDEIDDFLDEYYDSSFSTTCDEWTESTVKAAESECSD